MNPEYFCYVLKTITCSTATLDSLTVGLGVAISDSFCMSFWSSSKVGVALVVWVKSLLLEVEVVAWSLKNGTCVEEIFCDARSCARIWSSVFISLAISSGSKAWGVIADGCKLRIFCLYLLRGSRSFVMKKFFCLLVKSTRRLTVHMMVSGHRSLSPQVMTKLNFIPTVSLLVN